jgi:hypothetical protein
MKLYRFVFDTLFIHLRTAVLAGMVLLLTTVSTAQMAVRLFPANALRGVLEVTEPPMVLINGEPARLSPGARIKGVNNLIVLSGTLVGQRLLVNYVRDGQGMLHDVWILNEQEAQRNGVNTVTPTIFESEANQPKTDDDKTQVDPLSTLISR